MPSDIITCGLVISQCIVWVVFITQVRIGKQTIERMTEKMLEPAPRHESERKLLLSSKSTEGIHSVCSKHQGRMPLSLSKQPWNEDQNGCSKRLGQTTKQKFRWLVEGNGGLGHTLRWGSLTRTVNFQMFKLVLEKAEEPEIKLPTSLAHGKSKRVPEKHLFLLYWRCQSLWLCGSQ